MGKRIVNTAVSFGMAWQAVTGHLDTDVTVVRDAMEVRAIVVDNGVSAVAVSEDEKQLLDDVAAQSHVPETQSANETYDPRHGSADAEEAATPPEKEPEGNAAEQEKNLLHAKKKQEEDDQEKAKENLALGDREEVSGGNIIAPASPASGESTVTGEGSAVTAADDEARAEAAGEADQARADDESHEQAATEDEERLGRPAEESEPGDETWVNHEAWVEDEAWMEDDDDVNDPDID